MKTEKMWNETISIIMEEEGCIIGDMLHENRYHRYYAFNSNNTDVYDNYTNQRFGVIRISKRALNIKLMTFDNFEIEYKEDELKEKSNTPLRKYEGYGNLNTIENIQRIFSHPQSP